MLKSVMTDRIREQVRIELARRNLNKTELAERVGISRQQLSSLINGRSGNLPESWEKVFDELGVELVLIPKGEAERR